MQLVALDDLDLPIAGAHHCRGHLRPLIAGITEARLDERKASASLSEERAGTVTVLHVGRIHHDIQQEAERVDEDVALAARRLLAGVIALADRSRPPFKALRAV